MNTLISITTPPCCEIPVAHLLFGYIISVLIMYQDTNRCQRLFVSTKRVMEGRVEGRVGYQRQLVQHELRTEMDRVLREIGMSMVQYPALGAGGAPGLSGAELARRSFVTPQAMNAVLMNLEAAGLVVRRPPTEHGRLL